MLRRVVANLRRQDWTAVAVELVVVVIGVFLGVQAANWNEDREKNQKSAVFTERLKADLRVEAWNYEMQVGYYDQVRANALRAADALSGRAALADEALLVAAYRATQINRVTHRRATYAELTSTGEIGLIRDSQLRTLAMDVYTSNVFDVIEQEGLATRYRQEFRMRIPNETQDALSAACGDHQPTVGDYAAIATVLDYPCKVDLPAADIAATVAALRGDAQLLPLLRQRVADIGSLIGELVDYNKSMVRPLRAFARTDRTEP